MDTMLRLVATLLLFWIIFKLPSCQHKKSPLNDLFRKIIWYRKSPDISADFDFNAKNQKASNEFEARYPN
ncbi:hypothetical protein IK146_03615 [Candidatus Saccharibacteria bacterium]|nr:hypothetical protein [Candidatus Saccharibacteria bacterium]